MCTNALSEGEGFEAGFCRARHDTATKIPEDDGLSSGDCDGKFVVVDNIWRVGGRENCGVREENKSDGLEGILA